ncbi:MAG: cytochrome c3 family protein [Acidobacteriota bacterium]|nr:cytochrome c3 family protein [Acidobacteriota bacterium]
MKMKKRTTSFGRRAGALAARGMLALTLSLAGSAFAQVLPAHLDRANVPQGCLGCHAGGHGAKGTALLKAGTSGVCLGCHDLRAKERSPRITPRLDLRASLDKASRHPVEETSALHRRGEPFPERNPGARRHVACADCHDVHWSRTDSPLARLDGLDTAGARVRQDAAEFEVCYKCHADDANLPRDSKNKRLEFNRSNPSFHPVEAAGRSLRVPSLIPPWNVQSTMKCSDCHGSDDTLGPKGPHGSIYGPILVAHYETNDALGENSFQYALCYKCHDRSSILANRSFPLHNLHVVKAGASCYACHTAHGSQVNTHLVSFNPAVVTLPKSSPQAAGGVVRLPQAAGARPAPFAIPQFAQPRSAGTIEIGRYVDLGNGHGQCSLSCHGVEHNPASY